MRSESKAHRELSNAEKLKQNFEVYDIWFYDSGWGTYSMDENY